MIWEMVVSLVWVDAQPSSYVRRIHSKGWTHFAKLVKAFHSITPGATVIVRGVPAKEGARERSPSPDQNFRFGVVLTRQAC